jgi:hypothetical protein
MTRIDVFINHWAGAPVRPYSAAGLAGASRLRLAPYHCDRRSCGARTRRGRLIAPNEEAFGRAAKPAQNLKHDGAGHRALRGHGPQRAHADGNGRSVLERLADLGGKLVPCQFADASFVVERRLQRMHIELQRRSAFPTLKSRGPRRGRLFIQDLARQAAKRFAAVATQPESGP